MSRTQPNHRTGYAHMALIPLVVLISMLVSCAPASVQRAATAAPSAVPIRAAPAAKVLGSDLTEVAPIDDRVVVPSAGLAGGKAAFYSLRSGDKVIPFFVVTGADGTTRAALDACDVCFESHLGYRQEGDMMICNACGNRFPVSKINLVSGGCNPIGLSVQLSDDQIVLQLAELKAGARYF